MSKRFTMKFDPKTIEHLGVRMYATLPPALAELISNAYDADASEVKIKLAETATGPSSISVTDDGHGMSALDIQEKFLVIGRNRRKQEGDVPTDRFNRLATGKKGLGKLALFGLSKHITIDTVKNGLRNRFSLDWDSLMTSEGEYSPSREIDNEKTSRAPGTTIKLSKLKRQSSFDIEALADSLSKIFVADKNFKILLNKGHENAIVNELRRYKNFNKEFEWDLSEYVKDHPKYKDVVGKLFTAETPIRPNSGLRGISIFSRGKLVNAPEFFSSSTSSHFYQYLTGWIQADFIDELDEDVISTNRQSINWDNDEMTEFRDFLSETISSVNASWREKRRSKKGTTIKDATGIDTEKWMSTMSADVREQTSIILDTLNNDESITKYVPIVEALHRLVPEYPELHWRHLHGTIRERVRSYYENEQYGDAADQGVKIYCESIRKATGLKADGTDLIGKAFGTRPPAIQIADISTESGNSMQQGQDHLSRGLIMGFRNPLNHSPIDSLVPSTFSEVDCLDVLSLTSYLVSRIEAASDSDE
ncbi:TIGR02391 family protein [Pseudomonas syringae]|uniref:TIGR02391 family protein n=1 Tax=Pseudomonas syringae TaxID=317 RepID=UPI000BB66789|nr:TIGR02391 family protein [Pseudomonas syringae]MCK9754768.1 TIGR02391 family protein [Pseudomonas syringae pv. syringae]PBP84791.1 TIGR02391 family protein [Pseudomonas syringae]